MGVVESIEMAGVDFLGVWRTRSGRVVRVLHWHSPWGQWIGKTVEGAPHLTVLWDALGNAADPELDLVQRVVFPEVRVRKFGR